MICDADNVDERCYKPTPRQLFRACVPGEFFGKIFERAIPFPSAAANNASVTTRSFADPFAVGVAVSVRAQRAGEAGARETGGRGGR